MASNHPVYPDPGPAYSTIRSSDVYRCREVDALFNAYADACVALNGPLQAALEQAAEVAGVSVDEQDTFIRGARRLVDELFSAAADHLDDQGIDGHAVLSAAASKFPFDDEVAAIKRENVRRTALTAPLSSGNGEGL